MIMKYNLSSYQTLLEFPPCVIPVTVVVVVVVVIVCVCLGVID